MVLGVLAVLGIVLALLGMVLVVLCVLPVVRLGPSVDAQAKEDGVTGWITVAGNQGTLFLEPV